MKRLIVKGARDVEFEEVPIPDCPTDGLLVKASVTAISTGTELRVYRAIPVDPEGKFMHAGSPYVLPTENGYSMVGTVVEVGSEVEGFAEGDRVFVPEAHKEYGAVAAEHAYKLPDELPDEQAVFLHIMGVGHIALRRGEPAPGANIAVLGQGVVGLSALAYSVAFGMRTAAIDTEPVRLDIARKMGADLAVSPTEADFQAKIDEVFWGLGADIAIEAASVWPAVKTALDVVRTGGKVVVISRHTDTPDFSIVNHPYFNSGKSVMNVAGFEPDGQRWDRRTASELTLSLLSEGKIDIAPMITHRIGWQELPDAYARLDKGDLSMVGIVVRWD